MKTRRPPALNREQANTLAAELMAKGQRTRARVACNGPSHRFVVHVTHERDPKTGAFPFSAYTVS